MSRGCYVGPLRIEDYIVPGPRLPVDAVCPKCKSATIRVTHFAKAKPPFREFGCTTCSLRLILSEVCEACRDPHQDIATAFACREKQKVATVNESR